MLTSLLFAVALAATGAKNGSVPAPNVTVGDAALLFSLPAVNEEAALRAVARPHVALSDFTGVLPGFPARVVVVQFVNKAGSEAQLQALNRLHRKYANRGARFLAIVADDGELAPLSEWVESQRLEFPVLRDAHRIVVERYGVRQFPLTVVVNAEGDIEALGVPKDDLEANLETLLTPFLTD
ncbi:MAG: TlpA disulfide reductase family protein [Pseudomonadota bacterium]|nr:TlpA disulfide reductase family protein [Pseudomonadota bacterium]